MKKNEFTKTKLERKEKKSEGNDKFRFFIYGFKINSLVRDSISFVAVLFILESLEGF